MELENVLRARGLLTTDKNGELEFTTPPLPPGTEIVYRYPDGSIAYRKITGAGKKKRTKLDLLLTKPKKRKRDETIEDEAGQKHSTHSGALTEAEKDHMERCMEKKAKLYDDLKKGKVTDKDGRYHIDWDRKHAEAIERGENLTESDEEDDGPKDIKTIDEFGRTVWMSKKQHEKKIKLDEEQEKFWEEHSVIPVQPAKLIYGDTIQTAAFTADDASAKWDEVRKRNDELYKTSTFFDPKMVCRELIGGRRVLLTDLDRFRAAAMALRSFI